MVIAAYVVAGVLVGGSAVLLWLGHAISGARFF